MDQNNFEQPRVTSGKKEYAVPELTVYGAVKELVQSGSKGNPEGASGKPDKKGAI